MQLCDDIAIVIASTNVFEQLCKSCCESAPLLAISNPLSSATQGDIEDIDLLKSTCQHNYLPCNFNEELCNFRLVSYMAFVIFQRERMLRPFGRSQTSLALNSILESLAVNFQRSKICNKDRKEENWRWEI